VLLLVKLTFKSALCIGGDEEFQGIIHSDTIFSALLNEWVRLYPKDNMDDIAVNPPFTISSAFPYDAGEYYLPTPTGSGPLYMNKLKDQPFLDLYDFLDLAEGRVGGLLKKDLQNPLDDIAFRLTAPRVTLDRLSATSNLFDTTGWRFKDGGGLYFLAIMEKPEIRSKFEFCVRMLGESGLGGERSVGYGVFDCDITGVGRNDDWSKLFDTSNDEKAAYCTLSLVCPSEEEKRNTLSYKLIARRGWIFSRSSNVQLKRRECRMFAEGSLFSKPMPGYVPNVTPDEFTDHQVYRYGLGMMIAMRQPDGRSTF
jgi:CRISPR-associated protein Csm4